MQAAEEIVWANRVIFRGLGIALLDKCRALKKRRRTRKTGHINELTYVVLDADAPPPICASVAVSPIETAKLWLGRGIPSASKPMYVLYTWRLVTQ